MRTRVRVATAVTATGMVTDTGTIMERAKSVIRGIVHLRIMVLVNQFVQGFD